MYKLMIVEDEDLIRNGIVNSIRWDKLGFTVIHQAANGSEALRKIERETPDVVLTDVRMPVMDGLELTKIISERYKDITVVILSGFADFEYAQKAIQFNVFEYLLKPTNKKQFIDTFTRLKAQLDKKQDERDKAIISSRKLNEGLQKLREEFMSRVLNGSIDSIYTFYDRANYLELDLAGNFYTVATICVDIDDALIIKEWQRDEDLLLYSYYNIIDELLYSKDCGCVYVKNIREITIIFSYDKKNYIQKLAESVVRETVYHIGNLLFQKSSKKIYAGLGACCQNATQIHKSYLQSKKALEKRFFNDNENFFIYADEPIEVTFDKNLIRDYPEEANNIVTETISGNVDNTLSLIEKFFSQLYSIMNPTLVRRYCYVLCFLLKNSLTQFNGDYKTIEFLKMDFEHDINNARSMACLEKYIIDAFTKCAKQVHKLNDLNYSYQKKIIEQVKQYINDNFSKDLTLEEISNYVYLSPTYLSFLFKNEAGETYTEYLKKVRMQHAKDLLKQIDLKIYEVANMVGYNDYKYFTLQFKKIFGITPTEYRNKV